MGAGWVGSPWAQVVLIGTTLPTTPQPSSQRSRVAYLVVGEVWNELEEAGVDK